MARDSVPWRVAPDGLVRLSLQPPYVLALTVAHGGDVVPFIFSPFARRDLIAGPRSIVTWRWQHLLANLCHEPTDTVRIVGQIWVLAVDPS